MFDLLMEISKYFLDPETILIITVFGYYTFFVALYSRDEKSRWNDFQWGDRVLLGFIFGLVVWLFLALPIAVYVELFCLVLKADLALFRLAGPALPGSVLLLTGIILGLLRLDLERPLYSTSGRAYFQKSVPYFFPTFIIFNSVWFFLFWPTVFSWLRYPFYPFVGFWFPIAVLFLFSSLFLLIGFSIFYALSRSCNILRADIFETLNKIKRNWVSFWKGVSHPKLRLIAQNWLLVSLFLSFVATWAVVEIDRTTAIFAPIYGRGTPKKAYSDIYLFRKPEGPTAFGIEMKETITVKTPLLPSFNYLVIVNPSNFSLQSSFGSGPYTSYQFELSFIEDNTQFIRIKSEELLVQSTLCNVTLFYYIEPKPNVTIDETLSRITEFGNGTREIRYSLVISNNEPYAVHSLEDFATVNLIRHLHIPEGTNYKVVAIENSSKKDRVYYDVDDNWFYPEIWVRPNESVNFTYVFGWATQT